MLTAIQYKERVTDKSKAIYLLKTACPKRYGRLMQDIRDQYSFKIDVYPANITEAYELFSSYHNSVPNTKKNDTSSNNKQSGNKRNDKKQDESGNVGMSYLQDNGIAGVDGRFICYITWYRCGCKGHYADNFPDNQPKQQQQQHHMRTQECVEVNEDDDASYVDTHKDQHLQVDSEEELSDESSFVHFQWAQIALTQQQNNRTNTYKDTDILINTGSTFSVFKNPKMLLNIRKSSRPLKAITNGGNQISEDMGDLPGFFPVWFNTKSMLNILSWRDARKKFCITVDTDKGAHIKVHLDKDRRMYFEEVRSGLYLFKGNTNGHTTSKISSYSFLTLIKGNHTQFTRTQIEQAKTARKLYQQMGYPGYNQFFWLIRNNKIKGCQVNLEDAKRAIHLYGPDVAVLRGRNLGKR